MSRLSRRRKIDVYHLRIIKTAKIYSWFVMTDYCYISLQELPIE